MKLNLPLHPTKRHPITGEPLRAVWVRPDGRVMWPIMGGAPDDQTGDDTGTGAGDADKGADADKDKGGSDAGVDDAKDRAFPANTPVAEMTAPQQAAYWQHQARKHETRATEYRQAAGGKTAAEVQSELDTLRREKMSADERVIDDAKRQTREEVTREYGPRSVRTAFDLLLGDMPEGERNAELELLDLTKFLTDSGAVDTAKVRRAAEKIAPADKGTGSGSRVFDFGAGNRGGSGSSSGVAAGAELHASRRQSTQTTT